MKSKSSSAKNQSALSPDIIQTIEDCGKKLMPLSDVILILNEKSFQSPADIRHYPEADKAYRRGVAITKMDFRKKLIDTAMKGAPQASAQVAKILKDLNLDNHED